MVKRNDELFLHDGWQIALVLDSKGKVKDRFLWGAKQDELLCENDNWTLCDHLGTVRNVVNAKGKIVSHLEYNAFGELMNATGDKPLFRYTGKLFDDVSGLQWNINRWYDAKVGRWCSEDPIRFIAGYNLYCYVKSNPLRYNDLAGLECNAENVGTYMASTNFSFGAGNIEPGKLGVLLDIAMLLVTLSIIPNPTTSLDELIINFNPVLPGQADLLKQLMELKAHFGRFDQALRLSAGLASAWSKTQCYKCKTWCEWGGLGKRVWDWVPQGGEKWVRCDLEKTEWVKNHKNDVAFGEDNLVFWELLNSNATNTISEQCNEQAENSCSE